MLLKISTTHKPATDLGYLLHKHPDKLQSVEIPNGHAHIFYPESGEDSATVALLLDIDPVGLVRNASGGGPDSFSLQQYVNDRPYVASSFMSVAIAKAFSSAINGKCIKRPELVDIVMPLEACISVLPAAGGGEFLIRKLFEPLGYTIEADPVILDPEFPEWGKSKYFTVKLTGNFRLKELLSHLYILIPVLDNEKHYWVNQEEVEKLLQKGEGWLQDHPEKEFITKRYLRDIGGLTRHALDRLMEKNEELTDADGRDANEEFTEADIAKETLHTKRLRAAMEELVASGAKSILDLGCGEGKLLKMLLKEKQFEKITGVDVSYRTLEKAMRRINYHTMPPLQKARINIVQGSLIYRDKRLEGYDAAAIVEVIEHLELNRLEAFENVVFASARPNTIILTTPNSEYNELYETMKPGAMRHEDHRFEWNRREFESWTNAVAMRHNYTVKIKPVGDEDECVGAPSQMAVFKKNE
ncbi:MAG TPA: 3' terminal RNA ribose 2'-O-methyltransferase Hen1 [Ohtaekwangia sp.]|uniref:3' terminal RNA ribose 2'-O-methyltransferase Hen1 n=1 Tax=Ohtaekwangia sp. TaxID=2066019 RepID=UPI002F93A573